MSLLHKALKDREPAAFEQSLACTVDHLCRLTNMLYQAVMPPIKACFLSKESQLVDMISLHRAGGDHKQGVRNQILAVLVGPEQNLSSGWNVLQGSTLKLSDVIKVG